MRNRWFAFVMLALFTTLGACGRSSQPSAQTEPRLPADVHVAREGGLTWYGQSFFIVRSKSGARIASDPYHIEDGINYSPPKVEADVVFVSHEHFDHNNVSLLKGGPKVIGPLSEGTRSGALEVGLAKFPYKSVFSYHDAVGGKERGANTINVVTVDGVRIAHLGDLGAPLTPEQVKEIGPVDILLVPVGGKFTIDAEGATKVVEQLKPKVVIPMHYKTPKITIPLAEVEPFLEGKGNVVRSGDTYTFTEKSLPSKTTIVVLKYKE